MFSFAECTFAECLDLMGAVWQDAMEIARTLQSENLTEAYKAMQRDRLNRYVKLYQRIVESYSSHTAEVEGNMVGFCNAIWKRGYTIPADVYDWTPPVACEAA